MFRLYTAERLWKLQEIKQNKTRSNKNNPIDTIIVLETNTTLIKFERFVTLNK